MVTRPSTLSQAEQVYAAYLRGLTRDERDEFLVRLRRAQAERPLNGYRLTRRLFGLKSAFLLNKIGNSAYGRSLRAYRGVAAKQRSRIAKRIEQQRIDRLMFINAGQR